MVFVYFVVLVAARAPSLLSSVRVTHHCHLSMPLLLLLRCHLVCCVCCARELEMLSMLLLLFLLTMQRDGPRNHEFNTASGATSPFSSILLRPLLCRSLTTSRTHTHTHPRFVLAMKTTKPSRAKMSLKLYFEEASSN